MDVWGARGVAELVRRLGCVQRGGTHLRTAAPSARALGFVLMKQPNNRINSARVARPTRKADAPWLVGYAER